MRRSLALMILLFAMVSFLEAQEQPPPAPAPTTTSEQQKEQVLPQFTKPQLEELVAPIALYPDDLLAQILAASTYPVDIVEAARFIKKNPSLNQEDINRELKVKKWDPSVKGVVFFPELLAKMNDNMDWTKDLGDAFLTQPADVMDTIQVMRKKAEAAGYLNSDPNQKVTTNTEGQTEIQPTNAETVYVQDYMPSTAYGSDWGYHDEEDEGYWDYSGVIAAPAWPYRRPYACAWALGYRCGWGRGSLAYNDNFYNSNFYKNNLGNANISPENRTWSHNPANARRLSSNTQGVSSQSAQNFKKGDSAASKDLKQNIKEGDRTQAAKAALETADRAQVAARAQSSDRVQAAKTVAQAQPRPAAQPAMSGSRNAHVERAYSSRGAQSRTVSAHTTNKGGAVKSHAGSPPKAAAKAPQRKAGGAKR